MKQKFVVILHLNGEKPVTPMDLALYLKHLPIDASKVSFQIREEKRVYDKQSFQEMC
jgi:hypothetical protein